MHRELENGLMLLEIFTLISLVSALNVGWEEPQEKM